MLSWIVSAAAASAALYFGLRLYFVKKSVKEITDEIGPLISEDTNGLITVSGGGRAVRNLAAELNRSLKKLKELRRMYVNGDRELKEAVTNISHDLRTPLTAICGYLDLLKREEKSAAAEKYLVRIGERTEAMKNLTEELFRYSVILSTSEDMTLEYVDLGAVLQQNIAGLYAALTERGIEPVISIAENIPPRLLNKEAVSRVYGNILGNALKYSDGDLTVTMDSSGSAEFSNTAKNLGGVDVGKLFDRFFSVEAARNSTGLGLAISKTLVEQMGGEISARINGDVLTVRVSWDAGERGQDNGGQG